MIDTRFSPLILAKGLCKRYPSGDAWVRPLQDADIKVYPDQFVAIMGPSGSGKSTLLHILGFLDRPDKGAYCFNGQDISLLEDDALSLLRASRVGFVFQTFNLISQCTLLENIMMPFLYHPEPPENAREVALIALQKVGLAERRMHRPDQLSGGEMQRAAIARALVVNPIVILADEPTGNLDAENTRGILKIFKEMNENGTSLVVVTHDIEVARAAHRVLFINDGRLNE